MFFSSATVYAFQALAAMPDDGTYYQAKELASGLDLPYAYLSKVLTILATKGVLVSVRGRTGGYRLASQAHLITLGDVVTALDGPTLLPSCLMGASQCDSHQAPCPIQTTCGHVLTQVDRTLRQVTIQQLQTRHELQVRKAPARPALQRWVG